MKVTSPKTEDLIMTNTSFDKQIDGSPSLLNKFLPFFNDCIKTKEQIRTTQLFNVISPVVP